MEKITEAEIKEFLKNYGTKVRKNEPDHYVELMMDNHKCIQFGKSQYYIADDLTLTNREQEIWDLLAYKYHV